MSKAKKATLELDSMIDEINATADKNKDKAGIAEQPQVEPANEIIFPVDSEGNMILTSLLDSEGKPYVPEEDEKLPFVYLGRPSTLRLLSKEDLDKLTDCRPGVFWQINQGKKIWKLVSDNACQFYVDSNTTIITKLGWGHGEGASVGYTHKDNICPILIAKESTLQVDEINMLGITILNKTRIFGGYFYTRGFEAYDTYLRGDHFNIEDTEFNKTTIEGSFVSRNSSFYESKLCFCESSTDISNFERARINHSDINLGRNDRLEVTNFTVKVYKFCRSYSAKEVGYRFKISLRVHYGHFSGIYDLPFITTKDNEIMVDGTIFNISEFPQGIVGKLRRVSRERGGEEDYCLSSSGRNEVEERNLVALHHKFSKLLFGKQVGPISNSEHVDDLLSSLVNQVSSRLRLLNTLKVLSVTETQYRD